jgi:hypothetical protein
MPPASINELPAELITPVCHSLPHAHIVSLRHTSRQLTVNTADAFRDVPLESITVTCSKARLERLHCLVTTVPERANQVKHVTIHVLTPWGLKGPADTFDQDSKDNLYLLAYTQLRTALVNGLNALPNLQSITITNSKFQDITEPPFRLVDQRSFERFDPICEVDRKTHGYRLTPCLYAFESH